MHETALSTQDGSDGVGLPFRPVTARDHATVRAGQPDDWRGSPTSPPSATAPSRSGSPAICTVEADTGRILAAKAPPTCPTG